MVNPKLYALSDNLQTRNVESVIEEFAEDLKDMSGNCMDIGCGPGNSTKDLLLPALHPDSTMIGTDIDESMIEYANRNYSDRKRLKFDVLNIQTKYLPKKYVSTFDHIFSFHALHWCTDIEQAFRNIYRMLRPGGNMLILIIASHDVANTFKTLAEDIRFAPYLKDLKHTYPFNNVPYPQKTIKILLKNIGFTIRHCSLRERFSMNQDKFIDSMVSMCSSLDKMTADRKKEFKSSFKNEFISRKIRYTSRNNGKEQTYMLDIYSMLIIYAEKEKNVIDN